MQWRSILKIMLLLLIAIMGKVATELRNPGNNKFGTLFELRAAAIPVVAEYLCLSEYNGIPLNLTFEISKTEALQETPFCVRVSVCSNNFVDVLA